MAEGEPEATLYAWQGGGSGRSLTLRRKPFLRPHLTWIARISPRLTRCHTVCLETPNRHMV